jgi:hypothetical protein
MPLFMVVEHYRGGDPGPVYRRFHERGRMLPPGVSYVASWVTTELDRCYQVMDAADRAALDPWIASWSDLADFEVYPVLTSADASRQVSPG